MKPSKLSFAIPPESLSWLYVVKDIYGLDWSNSRKKKEGHKNVAGRRLQALISRRWCIWITRCVACY